MESLAAFSSAIAAIAALVSIIFLYRQNKDSTKAIRVQTFIEVLKMLQDEDIRKARKCVYSLQEHKKYEELTEADLDLIDFLYQRYETIAVMLNQGIINESDIVEGWIVPLKKLWPICKKRIYSFRDNNSDPTRGKNLEELMNKKLNK